MNIEGRWTIRIETLDTEPDSGTTANVFLTIYGKNRATAALPLNLPSNMNSNPQHIQPFQAGQIDEFEVKIYFVEKNILFPFTIIQVTSGYVGDIIKIRINHDNHGDHPDWLVGSVQMENKDTHELLVFTFNRWFSFTKDNHEIARELPAIHESGFILPGMFSLNNI